MSLEWIQNDFSGGFNQAYEAIKIGDNQFHLLINGRIRGNSIRPVRLPVQVTEGIPAGVTLQGIYGFDRYLVLFANGYAYHRDLSVASSQFENVANFSMPLAEGASEYPWIYAEAVPASSMNFQRKLASEEDNSTVNLASPASGSPVCIICQDGVNQPWKIFPSGTAVVTQTYAQWARDGIQEYVPIGTMMFYDSSASKLYLVAKDASGRYTKIFHSVSGRPTDFMVNIDKDGNKQSTEAIGGAISVSHGVSFAEITAIERINASDKAFFVGTLGQSFLVTPDYTKTIFAEPRFSNYPVFTTGPTDSQALVDINGDTVFIDQKGIKSFNAVKQQKTESNSTQFSKIVAPLFSGIVQTTCAAIVFDDYALFAVNTKYGRGILVYDINDNVFVALDIYPGVAAITQFATVKVNGAHYLFFITSDNKVYQAFVGATATCELYAGEWCSNDAKENQKPVKLALAFSTVAESGTVTVTPYVDAKEGVEQGKSITSSGAGISLPYPRPYPTPARKEVANLVFDLTGTASGWKVGFYIVWNCDAALSNIHVISNSEASQVPLTQQSSVTTGYTPVTGS